jgi:phosphoserine / homoserine phosphotransferase
MFVICSDLEGVFVPEVWINVAKKTGIEELRLTTRDISDYDVLMQKRLAILKQNNLKLADITAVIATMDPMDGAVEMVEWMRATTQLILLSDTFVEFAKPLMQKLGWPTLFCHSLAIDPTGAIAGYNLRQPEGKKRAVQAMQSLNYDVIAMGDSYNDIAMLKAADHGILFRPPENVIAEYPELPVTYDYQEMRKRIENILEPDKKTDKREES